MDMIYLKNVSSLSYNSDLCTGCRYCEMVCPRGVFKMESKKARLLDKDRCIECGACQNNCESGAIRVDTGVGCSSAYLYSMFTGKKPACGVSEDGQSSGCC